MQVFTRVRSVLVLAAMLLSVCIGGSQAAAETITMDFVSNATNDTDVYLWMSDCTGAWTICNNIPAPGDNVKDTGVIPNTPSALDLIYDDAAGTVQLQNLSMTKAASLWWLDVPNTDKDPDYLNSEWNPPTAHAPNLSASATSVGTPFSWPPVITPGETRNFNITGQIQHRGNTNQDANPSGPNQGSPQTDGGNDPFVIMGMQNTLISEGYGIGATTVDECSPAYHGGVAGDGQGLVAYWVDPDGAGPLNIGDNSSGCGGPNNDITIATTLTIQDLGGGTSQADLNITGTQKSRSQVCADDAGTACFNTHNESNFNLDFTGTFPTPTGSCPDPDTDLDGIDDTGNPGCNGPDNCINDANPLQEDYDLDGAGDACDTDDDNDTVLDGADADPLDEFVCQDTDGDTCDDCSVAGNPQTNNDGLDTDGDGLCNAGDTDDDNDTVLDGADADPLDNFVCEDSDADSCDDCSVAGTAAPGNDGTDTDSDGLCDIGDPDDDNDTVVDGSDTDPLNPNICQDVDTDSCDDCSVTAGPPDTANDGTDTDSDGACDAGDADDDNDTVLDGADADPLNQFICQDTDADTCDDCSVAGNPQTNNDGTDTDSDGACDAGDADDDNDGITDVAEAATGCMDPLNTDSDGDSVGDGIEGDINDTDADLTIDACDIDDDGDGVATATEAPLGDTDGDLTDDYLDTDDDGDGIPTYDGSLSSAGPPFDDGDEDTNDDGDPTNDDIDLDLIPNYLDTDSDGDGDTDDVDACPFDPDPLCGAPPAGHPSDVNGDCVVDALDTAAVIGNWALVTANGKDDGDVNLDGVVDALDTAQIIGDWAEVCP